jgi:ApbE superfamily uncharacterized protein (UPF0280 family)
MENSYYIKETFIFKETNCTIISNTRKAIQTAISAILYHREQLEEYVDNHPLFHHSFNPVPVIRGPLVAELMGDASKKANVGPMAAVAGVLADLAVGEMSEEANIAIVENGGEISVRADKAVNIAYVAGKTLLSRKVAFRVEKSPMGIATSSGLYSHALSFGKAEAVTVFSINAGIADAAATAIGNLIKGRDPREVICQGILRGLSIEGVEGVFIGYKGMVGRGGQIPQIDKICAGPNQERSN